MKANQDKRHFVASLDIITKLLLPDCLIENSSSDKLVGVLIDRMFNFNEYITNFCNKASKKIQALAAIFRNIPLTQRKLLIHAEVLPQFGY